MSNIKINDVYQRVQYSAALNQVIFTVPYPFFQNNYLFVWVNGIELNQGAAPGQYTVAGAGSPSGGTVTLVTPSVNGDVVTIEGKMPIDRTSIYSATISNLTGSDLNGDFNREVVMMKQLETVQDLLQIQYAPYALISQDVEVTKDRYIPILLPGNTWRKNLANTAIEQVHIPDGGFAPADATYWISSANAELPDAVDMHLLGEGLLKQSVVANVAIPAIAVLGTDYYGDGMTSYMTYPRGVKDSDGNTIIRFDTMTDAVNFGVIRAGATGRSVHFAAEGADTNVQITILAQAAGEVVFATQAPTNAFQFYSGTAYQHTMIFAMPNTANSVSVQWQDTSGTVAYLADVAGSVTSAQGTPHQILVNNTTGSPVTGDIILTLPQDIDTSSDVIFNSLQLTENLSSSDGGTGVNNGGNLFEFNGDMTWIGNFTFQATLTAATSVQFPTTGLLATTATASGHVSAGTTGQLAQYAVDGDTVSGYTLGTGVHTILGINAGSAGGIVIFNGDGGTPSAMVGTNITGTAAGLSVGFASTAGSASSASSVPLGGVTGLGSGVATALAITAGSAGGIVLFNGAGGTPSSMTGTNITGTAAGLTAGNASAVAVGGITGLGTGIATWLANPTSANFAAAITDETGTGLIVFNNAPTFIAPVLGAATATSIDFGGGALKTYKPQTTFTPTVTFATPGDLSVSYSSQVGVYTEIGNLVFVHIFLGFTPTFTTASGQVRIAGLPISATNANMTLPVGLAQSFTFPVGTTMLAGASTAGQSYLTVIGSGSGIAAANVGTTQLVSGVGYFLAMSGFYTNTSL